MSTTLGSTILSCRRTWAFTCDLLMSMMRRSLTVPSSLFFTMAAIFETTTCPKRFLTASQFGYTETNPHSLRRWISALTSR